MGSGLCERCEQLLRDFAALVRRLCAEIGRKVKECVEALRRGCCLGRTTPQGLLKRRQRRNAAYTLQHLDTDLEAPLLSQECLQALNTLAASESHELQGAASMYYLHVSQQLESPLPDAFLEAFSTLLLSNDLEVQRNISLSLVNLLVKNNVCEELVIDMGMLDPILEMFQSGDPTVQFNSCACIAMLASSESNREAIVSADGVIPLLILAKSYDPRVQENAVRGLLNLTRSERSMGVLCQEGVIPVLTLLLQSTDSEVQFYSCSALSNIAIVKEHHPKMLGIGDRFLLKSLLMLTSSSVQKNASQACRCLNILSGNGLTQEQLMELDCALPLKALLVSAGLPLAQSAAALLSHLSAHPPNKETLVNEGLLEAVGRLLLRHGASSVLISHSAAIITNLCSAGRGQQEVMDSECLTGLLQALVSSETSDDTLLCVTLCLHHLTSWDPLQSRLVTLMTPEHALRLVKLSGQMTNPELSYNSASIISKLQMNGQVIRLLQPHYPVISEYLLMFLKSQEVRFRQLGIVTLCNLKKDGGFVAGGDLEDQLLRVHTQTEQTRRLLHMIQQPASPSSQEIPPSSQEISPPPQEISPPPDTH